MRILQCGAGERLVVILSSPLIHAGLYRRTAEAFCRSTRVVVDLPGSGRSSKLDRALDMDELADLVPDLIHALGERSVLLIGHSNSGPIALLAAVHHRHCVAALVLADSVGAHRRKSLLPVLGGRLLDSFLEPRLTLVGWAAVVWNLFHHTRHFLSQIPRAAGDGWLPAATRVEVPTLIAWGRRDHAMPLLAAERFCRAMPHAMVVVSDSGSHDWIIEQPDCFAAAVLASV
ncbi:MAG: alpha/beta hydrolase [Lysobacter sp.]|nr:alpha/beta hydrolase [Lysobacter sp.]MDQ3269794.1 alpha/beta hydrolase [Pseudomonadota bacterium]